MPEAARGVPRAWGPRVRPGGGTIRASARRRPGAGVNLAGPLPVQIQPAPGAPRRRGANNQPPGLGRDLAARGAAHYDTRVDASHPRRAAGCASTPCGSSVWP